MSKEPNRTAHTFTINTDDEKVRTVIGEYRALTPEGMDRLAAFHGEGTGTFLPFPADE